MNNRNPQANVNAPVSYMAGGFVPAGSVNGATTCPYSSYKYGGIYARAALYAGPAGTTEAALTMVGPAVRFRTGAAAGYFAVGTNNLRVIPNVPPGSAAAVQVRVWDAGEEVPSYEEAVALPRGAFNGVSAMLNVTVGETGSPAALAGLEAFELGPLPTWPCPPPCLCWTPTPTNIVLSWEDCDTPARLQGQTNLPGVGLTDNWSDIAGATSPYPIPITSTNGSAFYRLEK